MELQVNFGKKRTAAFFMGYNQFVSLNKRQLSNQVMVSSQLDSIPLHFVQFLRFPTIFQTQY